MTALSSVDKYEYLGGGEILSSDQSRIIEQAKFTYSTLCEAFEKQIKTNEGKKKKQVVALKVLKPSIQKLLIKDTIPNKIQEI